MYKDRLGFKNYSEFGKAVGISGNWINELSKKEEIKQIKDMGNLINLCGYLGISIDQLIVNDDNEINKYETVDIEVDENGEDVGILIDKMILLLDKKAIRMNGILLNDKAKGICKDSLRVVKTLTRQHI